ncbi:MAG: pilus assembly protein [Planctomycetales bacterium]|nr:pilus assembly protein [Planctomycetales bacterium]
MPRRRATAVVELAVCLPLIVLLIFASLEGANLLFLRQAVVQSAYETAKSVAKSNSSQANATTLGTQVLAARGVVAPTITFSPEAVDALAAGTPFTVSVAVPGDSRSLTRIGPFRGLTIQAQATMLKE